MTTSAKTEALAQWFRCNGGFLHENVRIMQDEARGVHLRASAPIEPGTMIMSSPASLALSYVNALVDEAYPVFKQHKEKFTVEAIGFFYLMAQYMHRETSFWKPYLDTLPSPEEPLSQPLHFEDPADVAWLEGTDVWHTVCARKAVYEKYYWDGISVLSQAGMDVEPYTWHMFKWSTTIFSSRSFISESVRPDDRRDWTSYKAGAEGRQAVLMDTSRTPAKDLDFPVLFPGIDAANHNHEARLYWTFDPGRFSIAVNDGVELGAEIFNNYGPKGNDELLIGYGFCIPDNPHDTVAMTLKEPPKELQRQLRLVRPGYFSHDGRWNAEKATIRLQRPRADLSEPSQIFHELPEPLLELLTYLLRYERGLKFTIIERSRENLPIQSSSEQRHLPHIARILVQSLQPKLAHLPWPQTTPPSNKKQNQAAIYTQSQHRILQTYLDSLQKYPRTLIWTPRTTTSSLCTLPPKPKPFLARLEDMHYFFTHQNLAEAFLLGIEASTNTQDFDALRLAGWEDDLWVLLLSYIYLQLPTETERHGDAAWTLRVFPEYVLFDTSPTQTRTNTSAHPHPHLNTDAEAEAAQASDLMDIVHTAATAYPNSVWADRRWSAEFIAALGGRMVRNESVVLSVESGDGNGGRPEVAEARLYLCFG